MNTSLKNIWIITTILFALLFILTGSVLIKELVKPLPSPNISPTVTKTISPTQSITTFSSMQYQKIRTVIIESLMSNLPANWYIDFFSANPDPRGYYYEPENFSRSGNCDDERCIVFDNKKYQDTYSERSRNSLLTDNGRVWGTITIAALETPIAHTNEDFFETMNKLHPARKVTDCGPSDTIEPMQPFPQLSYPAVTQLFYPVCNYEFDLAKQATQTYSLLINTKEYIYIRVHYDKEDQSNQLSRNQFENAIRKLSF